MEALTEKKVQCIYKRGGVEFLHEMKEVTYIHILKEFGSIEGYIKTFVSGEFEVVDMHS